MIDGELYERLRMTQPDDIRPAAMVLRDLIADMCGLQVAASHNIASKEPMRDAEGEVLASSVFQPGAADGRWLQPYLALQSPLVAAVRLTAEPFWCNAKGLYTRRPNAMLSAIDLHHFADRARTRAAIVVPVHLPFGQVAAASLLSGDPLCDDLGPQFDASAEAAAIYVRRFLTSYVEVTQLKPHLSTPAGLTKREVECLRWAAIGKTNDEIGTILGLSRATVRFHIRNASTKLNAVNRDQTIFKAAQLGYLALLA